MVPWKLLCGLATVWILESVQGLPIEEDNLVGDPESIECMPLGADDFTGAGKEIAQRAKMEACDVSAFQQGVSLPSRRRLETITNRDMKKLQTYFGTNLETDFTKLASQCARHPIPWPSGYWPSYADSINFLWDKNTNVSASEKYAKSFKHDAKTFMDKVSALRGIDYMIKKRHRPCTVQADCNDLYKNVCSIRTGETKGCCIPKWPGICHAWAPAAILEPEPICPVTHNGVTFEPFDIKALITMTYDGSKIPTIFTGKRFIGDDEKLNGTDQYGRFLNEERRDLNPGFFHIAAINILCNFNYSFVIDISAGNEVWNQPVGSFEITRLSWMTPTDVAKKYFNTDKYPFNDAATNIAVVTSHLTWIAETGENGPIVSTSKINKFKNNVVYEYILELDDTYKILGGEWLGNSRKDHPDFLWLATRKPSDNLVTSVGLKYSEVKELLTKSIQGDCMSTTTTETQTSEQDNIVTPTEDQSAPTDAVSTSHSNSEPPTESPPAEAPQTEAPPAEAPQSDNPQTEAPQTEAPPAEAPSAEAPPAEAPDAENPQSEASVAEDPQAEAPNAEAPDAEDPQAEAPNAEAPNAEAPLAEAPDAEGL